MYGKKITFPHDRVTISDGSGCRQLPQMPVNVHLCSYMPLHARKSSYIPLKSLQRVILAYSYKYRRSGKLRDFLGITAKN